MNPSEHIDKEIADHPDWRGRTMGGVRRVIRETVPDVTEEWKWMGTPTWSHDGILCICNAFKNMVKVTFIDGAKLEMDGLFNAELGGNKWRAIKYFEGDAGERERHEEAPARRRGVECRQGKGQGEAGRGKGEAGHGEGEAGRGKGEAGRG